MTSDLLQRGKNIKLAIFDVDGVLTDGRLYFLEDGSEFKTFNTLDGQGIKMLMAAGVQTAIISGRKTPVVERRAQNLGIPHLYQGTQDQLAELAGGTFTATGGSDAMGVLANKCRRIGDSHAQAHPTNHRQVWQVIAQIGDLLIA